MGAEEYARGTEGITSKIAILQLFDVILYLILHLLSPAQLKSGRMATRSMQRVERRGGGANAVKRRFFDGGGANCQSI